MLGYADVDDILSLSSSKLDEWMEFYKDELWDVPQEVREKVRRSARARSSTPAKNNAVTKDSLIMLQRMFGGKITEG